MDPNAFMVGGGMQMQQRPQPPSEQHQNELLARIVQELAKTPIHTGWQATFDPRTRAMCILQLVKALRLLNNTNDLGSAVQMAMRFESQIVTNSPSEDQWMAGIKQKLNEISQAHQQTRMKAQQQQQQAMGMQMQPSRSHQGEMAPQMSMAPQMMAQMNMQPHMQPPPQQPPPQQQQQPQQQMAQNQQAQTFTQDEQKQIANLARSLIIQVPEDQRNLMRQRILATVPPQQREYYQRQGVDPVVKHFQQIAVKKFTTEKMRRAQGQAGGPIDFSSFAGQQADAMKMADQGQLVVPASNNNMGMDPAAANMANMNQMNMQPAMQNNQQQIQNMMAQRQQQTQAQMRNTQMQQQAQAQAQARNAAQQQAQQQMLRGQPGGLNTTQPPQQSPAMSMLNRPMVPPGQPSQTPPQSRPQPTPQPNQQINPQMMAQFSQQIANNPGLFPNSKPDLQIPPGMNLPPQLRAKIEGMPPEQQQQILQRMRDSQKAPQSIQAQQAQQMMMNNLNPGAAMGQQALPNAAMGMPPQAPLNPQQQMAMNMSGGLNQQQMQQKMLMNRQREHDARPFPPRILNEICTVPPNVKTWGQLKEFVQQNQQSLPPDLLDKVRRYQSVVIQKQNAAMANPNGATGNQMSGQLPQGPGPNHAAMAGSQAPPAQMVPQQPHMGPGAGMLNMNTNPQNFTNMSNMPVLQVTEQEMQAFRSRIPQGQSMSQEQLRKTVLQWKISQMQKQNPAMAAQALAALRQSQIQQQNGMSNMPPQNPMAPTVPQMGPQSAAMVPQMSQPPANIQQTTPANKKGQKRSGATDDVVEIPNPNHSPQRPAPNAQQHKNQKPTMQLDPEQLKNMHPDKIKQMAPEQRAVMQQSMQQLQQKMQMEALKRAQSSTNQNNPKAPEGQHGPSAQQAAQMSQAQREQLQAQNPSQPAQVSQLRLQQQRARLAAIYSEVETAYRKGPPQQVTDASFEELVQRLRGCRDMIVKLDKMLPTAMNFVNDKTLRQICLERARLLGEMSLDGNINGYFSLSTQQIGEAETSIRRFIMQCLSHIQKMKTTSSPEQMQQNTDQAKPPPAPLAATAAMARTASKSGDRSKPPPAPTSAVPPPFPVSHVSPHGVPVYDGKMQGLTPDKLQLPANKRRKTGQPGSSASTPVPANAGTTPGSMPSPNIKMQSPDDKRRQMQPKVEPPRGPERKFKCADEYCEFFVTGFEKEEELQAHTAETHKQIENPLDFLLENAAAAFELDMEGNEKMPQIDNNALLANVKPSALGPNTIKKEALKIDGQTPGKTIKAGTPSPFIKPGTPPVAARTPQGQKRSAQNHEPASASPKKKVMLDTMMEKAGVVMPTTDKKPAQTEDRKQSSTSPSMWNSMWNSNDADDNFMRSVRETLNGLDEGAQYSDMDWPMDPSPSMTPSSSNSGTSAATSNFTDISEHDRLKIMFESDPFGLGSGIQFDLGDDLGMGIMGIQSTFDNKKEDQNKATPPPDVSWDAMFGANAGLDRNDTNWDKDPMGNSLFEGVTFFDI